MTNPTNDRRFEIEQLKDWLEPRFDNINEKLTSIGDRQKTTDAKVSNLQTESIRMRTELDVVKATSSDHEKRMREAERRLYKVAAALTVAGGAAASTMKWVL